MNDDLSDLVTREMHLVSLDVADCPTLFERVSAGVHRRRRNRKVRVAALGIVAVMVAAPVVRLGPGTFTGSSSGQTISAGDAETGCAAEVTAASCGLSASARAELALRRANQVGPEVAPVAGDLTSCLHRAFCRGPV